MKYLLDTNIIVHYVRESATFDKVNNKLQLFSISSKLYVSEVSRGEILSFAKRNRWGQRKMERLNIFFSAIKITPISSEGIHEAYADIDAFSQSNHPTLSLPKDMTARNMGKNDLWIAATAHVLRATLVTTDKDFDHLQNFFHSEWIAQ